MSEYGLSQLIELVHREQFDEAAEYCRSAYFATQDPYFWETQLGYVYFLNEHGVDRYKLTCCIFESLIAKLPSDANAHFWAGYCSYILYNDSELAVNEMRETIRLDPNFPYAYLVLAGLTEPDEAEGLLEHLLGIQNNLRALSQLIGLLLQCGKQEAAKEWQQRATTLEFHMEIEFGPMNEYINDVFTGFLRRESILDEIKQYL